MFIQNRIEKHPLLALCLAAALLGGCASAVAPQPDGAAPAQTQAATVEEVIAQRAQAQFDHIVREEFEKAYAYMAPSYRALVNLEKFTQLYKGDAGAWKDAQIVSVTCDTPSRCAVRLYAGMELALRKGRIIRTALDEIWVLEDGEWWNYREL